MLALIVRMVIGIDIRPRRERPYRSTRHALLVGLVNVKARLALAGLAIDLEKLLKLFQHIGFGAEVTEVVVAALGRGFHGLFHVAAIVAMERVALHESGFHLHASVQAHLTKLCRTGAARAVMHDNLKHYVKAA